MKCEAAKNPQDIMCMQWCQTQVIVIVEREGRREREMQQEEKELIHMSSAAM